MTQEEQRFLSVLEEKSVITTSEKNLRSKIDSLIRSLENLSEKKLRIEFEIKRQKKALTRKREELKRVSKGNQSKLVLTLEESEFGPKLVPEGNSELRRIDSRLLQESNRLMEND